MRGEREGRKGGEGGDGPRCARRPLSLSLRSPPALSTRLRVDHLDAVQCGLQLAGGQLLMGGLGRGGLAVGCVEGQERERSEMRGRRLVALGWRALAFSHAGPAPVRRQGCRRTTRYLKSMIRVTQTALWSVGGRRHGVQPSVRRGSARPRKRENARRERPPSDSRSTACGTRPPHAVTHRWHRPGE